jgi:hypothetical protein
MQSFLSWREFGQVLKSIVALYTVTLVFNSHYWDKRKITTEDNWQTYLRSVIEKQATILFKTCPNSRQLKKDCILSKKWQHSGFSITFYWTGENNWGVAPLKNFEILELKSCILVNSESIWKRLLCNAVEFL